ncbi:MAG TPA: type II secretion system protein [Candidatus Thioglobus sp.]|nr:type II secretion system protein [Candidatus Thioglobus sp.]
MKTTRAFTLIELLVVVAIIGIIKFNQHCIYDNKS